MNDQTDPLARRSVTCPDCDGEGRIEIHNPEGDYGENCPVCHGMKHLPEPAEEWAERCAAIAREVAREMVCKGCAGWELKDDCQPSECMFGPDHIPGGVELFVVRAARTAAGKAAEG
jgi:hypothetical protein